MVRIALAGCGTVGGALLDLLARHGDDLARRRHRRFEVVRILVRDPARPRSAAVDRTLLTRDPAAFACALATDADVLVEATAGIEPAATLAHGALAHGRHVVTANKALVRAEGAALVRRATLSSAAPTTPADGTGRSAPPRHFAFEAAVGGGVPVVRLLRDALAGHGILRVRGVLNGTTNYILSRVERGASYPAALRGAQDAGFAEADATRDVTGLDAADKLAILAWLAFGADPARLAVHCAGLPDALEARVADARRRGARLRLVAEATPLAASVALRELPASDPLARAEDEENVIQVESESSGTITLAGRGAGGSATASALLADLLALPDPLPRAPAADLPYPKSA